MAGNLPDYPAPPGNKNQVIATVAGPSSYTQVSTGTPATGGQVITAAQLGLVDIEFATCSLSDNGQYEANIIFDLNPQNGVSSIRLIWVTAATGAQVAGATNLSGRTLRIWATGH